MGGRENNSLKRYLFRCENAFRQGEFAAAGACEPCTALSVLPTLALLAAGALAARADSAHPSVNLTAGSKEVFEVDKSTVTVLLDALVPRNSEM